MIRLFKHIGLGKTLLVFVLPILLILLFPGLETLVLTLGICLSTAYILFGFKLQHWAFYLMVPFLFISTELTLGGGSKLAFPSEPLLVLLVFSLFFGNQLWDGFKRVIKHSLGISILFWVASLWLATLNSTMPWVSIKFSIINTLYAVLGVLMGHLLQQKKKWSISVFLQLSSIPLAFISFYVLIRFIPYHFSPGAAMIVARPFFKDHTILAAVWALFIPLYLLYPKWNNSKLKTPFKHWPYLLSMLLQFILIVSSSRAAWLSLVAALLLGSFIYLGGRFKALLIFASLVFFTVLANQKALENWLFASTSAYNSATTNASLEGQLKSTANLQTDVSNLERLNRWKCALRMFEEKPFTGYGPGTYQFQYLPWQNLNEMTYISVTSPFVSKNGRGGSAHSEYLLSLSENGILGLLSWLGIIGNVFYLLFKRIQFTNSKERFIYIALLLSLTTYFIHAFFNNFLNSPSLGISFWLLLGFVLFHTSKTQKS